MTLVITWWAARRTRSTEHFYAAGRSVIGHRSLNPKTGLVRRVCPRCKELYTPSEEQLMQLDLTPEDTEGRQFYRGRGCDYCNQSGYKGRMAIFEIMVLDDDIRELIMQNASTQVLRSEARKRGMRTLRQSGLLSIYDGMTTIDEVTRETLVEEG